MSFSSETSNRSIPSWEKRQVPPRLHSEQPRQGKPIYVYDYSKDETIRIKDGFGFYKQFGDTYINVVPIPKKPGRLPIHVRREKQDSELVALVNISPALRFQRWIGEQKKLYVVGASSWNTNTQEA